MAIRDIKVYGDEVLTIRAEEVKNFDDDLRKLAEDLKDTLHSTTGIGLAAPQIGVSKRVVFIDLKEYNKGPITLVNPRIIYKFGRVKELEKCLSCPGKVGEVERPYKVTVVYYDLEGKSQTLNAKGLFARVICHEIDHLDGILYLDKVF